MAHRENIEYAKLIKLIEDTMHAMFQYEKKYDPDKMATIGTRHNNRLLIGNCTGKTEWTTDTILYRELCAILHELRAYAKERGNPYLSKMSQDELLYIVSYNESVMKDYGITTGDENGEQNP